MPTSDLIADSPPTMVQAQAAADVLRDEGASAVLLFGSLAQGRARPHSDLDLVAIFDDIDYSDRWPRSWRLSSLCSSAAGKPVDVLVTDWPEWEHRTRRVGSSMEAAISSEGVWLFRDEPDDSRVDWAKGIGMPESDLDEAVSMLPSIRKSLGDLRDVCFTVASRSESSTVDHADREDRLASLCSHAALTIEHSLKSLTALSGGTMKYSHDVAVLLNNCPEAPHAVIDALEPLRVNTLRDECETRGEYDDVSCWRILGTYMQADLPDPAAFGDLAVRLCRAAAVAADTTLRRLAESGADTSNEQFRLCHERLDKVRAMATNENILAEVPPTFHS